MFRLAEPPESDLEPCLLSGHPPGAGATDAKPGRPCALAEFLCDLWPNSLKSVEAGS